MLASAASAPDLAASTAAFYAQQAASAAATFGNAMHDVAIAASAVASAAAPKTGWEVTPDAFANGFATLVGAVAGALVAYVFQRRLSRGTEDRQEARAVQKAADDARQAELLALHHMLFCLYQQIKTVLLIQQDQVLEHIDEPTRFLSIPATQEYDENRFTFSIKDLEPLLKTPESRLQIYRLFLAQENYMAAINAWNLRSELHRHEVQPKLGAGGIANGGMGSWTDLENALGPVTLPSIMNMTYGVQVGLQRAFLKLESISEDFFKFAKARFPGEKFTTFDVTKNFRIKEEIKEIVPLGPPPNPYAADQSVGFYRYKTWTQIVVTPAMLSTLARSKGM